MPTTGSASILDRHFDFLLKTLLNAVAIADRV
jgi:hypothetical protein